MPQTVEAIFEQGILKPTTPLNLPEHKRVTLLIKEEGEETSDISTLAAMVYMNLSPEDIRIVEDIALDRSHFTRE